MIQNGVQHLLIALICVSAGCGKTTQPDAQDGHSATDVTEAPQVINEIPDVVVKDGFWAKVIGVVDGDTIDVLTRDRKTIRLRLNGVDCPEKGQPYGNNATEFTSKRIAGELVRVIIIGKPDRYGRLIADVYDENDQFHNMELVRFGFAWHYEKYAPDREDLSKWQRLAKEDESGLWAGSHQPVAPWEWRKLSKVERDRLR